MPTVTRTTGPLHFEDLEPKRFEDLVRSLAYDYRPWTRLEATGRAGSDDGFDARGIEGVTPEPTDTDEDEAPPAPAEGRLWLIQCKREQRIPPAKLVGYLDDIRLAQGERLYGIIFAAACDFSKRARDEFYAKCRTLGLTEVQLWGKAELEDMLYQPKNDHLLFAYFGFSLAIRQRSTRTALRSAIATKKRLKTVTDKLTNDVVLIRNAAGDMYPELPPKGEAFAETHWRICKIEGLRHDGLEVEFANYVAYMNDDRTEWDAANALGLQQSQLYHGRWPHDSGDRFRDDSPYAIWDKFDEKNRASFKLSYLIPYERILAVDDVGDEYFDGPFIYCVYEDGSPASAMFASVEPIEKYDTRHIHPGRDDDGGRIEVFPAEMRRVPK